MIWSDPWKTWVLPLTCRKSPGSNVRASPSLAFQRRAPTVPDLSRSSRWVEVSLPVGAELLVGDQEGLVDRVAVAQLIHVSTSHSVVLRGCVSCGEGTFPCKPFQYGLAASRDCRRTRAAGSRDCKRATKPGDVHALRVSSSATGDGAKAQPRPPLRSILIFECVLATPAAEIPPVPVRLGTNPSVLS